LELKEQEPKVAPDTPIETSNFLSFGLKIKKRKEEFQIFIYFYLFFLKKIDHFPLLFQPEDVALEGFLFKQGGVVKSWKQRFFVLDSNQKLCYYFTDKTVFFFYYPSQFNFSNPFYFSTEKSIKRKN